MSQRDNNPRLTPLSNWAFQKIFGSAGSENLTRSLVNAVLRKVGVDPVESVDSLAADVSLPNAVGLKAPRLDVLLMCDDRAIDLEAQLYDLDIENKATFYAAQLLASRVKKGSEQRYRKIPQTVVIVFAQGWVRFPDSEQAVTAGRLHWEHANPDGSCLPGNDRFLFVICELDKIEQRYNSKSEELRADELAAWLYTLARGYRDEREVDGDMQNIMSMEEFYEKYDLAMGDPDAWDAYDRHVKWIFEQNSIEDAAEQRGLKRGMERGEKIGLERGMKRGIERGIEQGLEQGREEGKRIGREVGMKQGIERGLEQGLVQGLEQGKSELAENLRALNVDEAIIQQALKM